LIEIEDAEIDWKEDYGNDPKLVLYVDELPTRDELRFQGSKEEGLWYAEHESGYVEFFSWSGGQGNGYNGRHYEIETVDGDSVTLKGPWSSRSGALNKAGYGPCLDVTYKTSPEQLGGRSGAITLEAAEEAIDEFLEGVELERVVKFSSEEPYWVPQKTGTGGDQ
jgi:hypothetical protein